MFYPGGYAHDYEWTSGALGFVWRGTWGSIYDARKPEEEGVNAEGTYPGREVVLQNREEWEVKAMKEGGWFGEGGWNPADPDTGIVVTSTATSLDADGAAGIGAERAGSDVLNDDVK